MKKLYLYLFLPALFFLHACSSTKPLAAGSDDGMIEITFIQVNDVYEIAPLDGGKSGGMARVATFKKEALLKNPNTYLVMAGDFLSPSVYNSLRHEGNRIRGKQMVEAMNTAGFDLAIFGNHEFDIPAADLQSRINESTFKWISSNTFQKKDNDMFPFVKQTASGPESFPETYIMHVKDADGTTARIGFIAVTLPFNKAAYVGYTDVFKAAQTAYDKIKDSCEAVIAITHQEMEDDIKLAKQIPGLAFIMGGHEHERHYAKIGYVYITKADANAKSAYTINLTVNKNRRMRKVEASLTDITDSIAFDPATDAVVKKWTSIANNNYASLGFDANKVALRSGEPLDGREAYIRSMPTNFTRLIVAAMEKASPEADAVIINSGSIRVDDVLQIPVTQYDVIRSLPYGGSIMEADMKGSLLVQVLNAGIKNRGSGGFLQYSTSFTKDSASGNWSLKNTAIDPAKVYKIALADFLLTGGESNLGFLTGKNPDIEKVYPVYTDAKDLRSDIRRAIIHYMEGLGK
ncbi:MAG: bifunctional metallophosphatase/5'-nucleotidase [Chitinophagaceae bacterium]|nr:bifunctional metallophosphatase/5'-nucleotidase [Chitinophagaceae bacterium]